MTALQNLDDRINVNLQQYLGTPVEDRTREQYSGLVDQLSRAAMDYAKAMVNERIENRRQVQKQVGGR